MTTTKKMLFAFFVVIISGCEALSFRNRMIPPVQKCDKIHSFDSPQDDRRSFIRSAIVQVATTVIFTENACASGGATAGGAYLITAKKRYSGRVSKGAAAYKALTVSKTSLQTDPFLIGKDAPVEDFMVAAFLLANAFRSNSTASPDSLPTVQKFKKFKKEYEAFLKLLNNAKASDDDVSAAYSQSVQLLDEFLLSVKL